MSQMDMRLYNAAMEKLAALGGLQASYVADAAGADADGRASQLAGDRARENEDGGLIDDIFGYAGDANRMISKRKRHGAAAFAENDVARLLNVVDPSKLITKHPDNTLTGLAMVSGKKKKDREGRVLDEYKDTIKKYQDPVDMDGEKTTRETPWHLLMQGQQADLDTDVAGHKQQRKEHPLNYWLNPVDRTGPLTELFDRYRRRVGAGMAQPDSALGRFGMGAGTASTLGLLGALTGGEDAQNKLRRSAVDNEIFDEHTMPEGADKPKDGDGDGKVNDGTSKEKEAELKPGTEEFNNALHNHMYGKDMPKKKKKKSEKEASSCGSHSKPKKKKSKKVEKAALELATKVAAYRQVQEKQARVLRIKLATHVVSLDTLRRELDKYDPYQLSKSAAIGAHKADRMKAAALVRQIELEKQAFLGGIVGGLGRGLVQGGAKALGGAAAGGLKAGAKAGLKGAYQGAKAGAKTGFGVDKAVGSAAVRGARGATRMAAAPARMAGRAIQGGAKGIRNGQGVAAGARSGLAQGFKKDPLAATAALGGTAMAGGAMAQQGYDKHLKQPMQQMAQRVQQIPQQAQQMFNAGQGALNAGQQQIGQTAQQAPEAVGGYFSNLGNAFMGR